MKKKYYLFAVLFTFLVAVLAGCVEEYKTKKVTATVVEKEYEAPKITYETVVQNGKKVKKQKYKPAEYEVTIKYKDIEKEFEDKGLYDRVEEGQKIQVLYKEGLNKKGEVVTTDIELIEQ
jgi:hypothetical protein